MRRLALAASLFTAACGGGRSAPAPTPPPVTDQPLNSFASLRLIVLPVQGLRGEDVLGWGARITDRRTILASLDSALDVEFRERGLATAWTLMIDLARTARRNPLYATQPGEIRAGDAVRVLERRREAEIPEPVGSQLRTLAGFHDARHALVPVEVRFESGSAAGSGRAVLRVAVLDVRASRLVFIGDVGGPDATGYSPSLVTGLARRFADLVAPR